MPPSMKPLSPLLKSPRTTPPKHNPKEEPELQKKDTISDHSSDRDYNEPTYSDCEYDYLTDIGDIDSAASTVASDSVAPTIASDDETEDDAGSKDDDGAHLKVEGSRSSSRNKPRPSSSTIPKIYLNDLRAANKGEKSEGHKTAFYTSKEVMTHKGGKTKPLKRTPEKPKKQEPAKSIEAFFCEEMYPVMLNFFTFFVILCFAGGLLVFHDSFSLSPAGVEVQQQQEEKVTQLRGRHLRMVSTLGFMITCASVRNLVYGSQEVKRMMKEELAFKGLVIAGAASWWWCFSHFGWREFLGYGANVGEVVEEVSIPVVIDEPEVEEEKNDLRLKILEGGKTVCYAVTKYVQDRLRSLGLL